MALLGIAVQPSIASVMGFLAVLSEGRSLNNANPKISISLVLFPSTRGDPGGAQEGRPGGKARRNRTADSAKAAVTSVLNSPRLVTEICWEFCFVE